MIITIDHWINVCLFFNYPPYSPLNPESRKISNQPVKYIYVYNIIAKRNKNKDKSIKNLFPLIIKLVEKQIY